MTENVVYCDKHVSSQKCVFCSDGCKTVLHMRNTRVKLDKPHMYRHGLGTLETERSNMNHIVDMINIEMFTIDDYPISRDDRTWVS